LSAASLGIGPAGLSQQGILNAVAHYSIWADNLRIIELLRFAMRVYSAVIERCPQTGFFVGFVPGFPGAHSQGETLDELNYNLQEAITMLLEDGEPELESEFIGVQNVAIAWVMGNIPVLKPTQVIAVLTKLGFVEVR
jgi:predicted RNase H-like HicB family nuclease